MRASYPAGGDADPSAVPGIDPVQRGEESPADVVVDVDGELFAISPDEFSGTQYTWLSGPNEGYGFATSPTPDWTTDQHRDNVRSFLAHVDPATGYLEDE